MPLYTVHAPPTLPGDGAPDPMGYVFVKEGFCWPAFFIADLWLLFRRMWIVFFAYVAVALVVMAIGERVGGPLPGVSATTALAGAVADCQHTTIGVDERKLETPPVLEHEGQTGVGRRR